MRKRTSLLSLLSAQVQVWPKELAAQNKLGQNYCLHKIILGQTAGDSSFSITSIKSSDSIDKGEGINSGDGMGSIDSHDKDDSMESNEIIDSVYSNDCNDSITLLKILTLLTEVTVLLVLADRYK